MAGTSSSEVVKGAYWPEWAADYFPPSTIDTRLFTHFYYAFLLPDSNTFKLVVSNPARLRSFTDTIHKKNAPVKTLLSVGGWIVRKEEREEFLEALSRMASQRESRNIFIESCIAVARKYGFDGIDLDWEFPQNPEDMRNLGILLKEWRAKVNKEEQETGRSKLLLTAAMTNTVKILCNPQVTRSFPVTSINENLDWVNVMCYDYCGEWTPEETGAHAAWLNPNGSSMSLGLESWIQAGLLRSKLIMGLPLYGKTWRLQDPNLNGVGSPAVGVGIGPDNEKKTMTYSEILKFKIENNSVVVYDPVTVSTYSYAGTSWIRYDDVRSISQKIRHAQELGLRGYFFWEVTGDHAWEISTQASRMWT